MSTTTPKRDLADLLHTVRRWLSARLPAGAGAGPDSSSESGLESEPDHHLSEEVVTEVLPNATDAQARPDRGAAPAPEGEWEAKIPGVELLTLPRYRLPTEQSEVATVAEEPPPIDSVAPDQAELTIHTENAISKADVYMAYGRYREAEDLIREEIQRRPERMELKFKLAAIYEASGRLDSLRALMLEMQEAGVEQSNPQDWWYLVDRVQVATAAVEADHVPDNQEEPVIDNLDLELDLDLDLDRDESAPVDQLGPVSASAQDQPPDEGLPDDTGVKLDLARVYLQIGDLESARDLLEEVVDEGTAAQWAEAQELLRGIV